MKPKVIPQIWRVLELQVLKVLTVPVPPEDTQAASTSTAGAKITKFAQKEDVFVAEVLWAVKTVVSHYSTSSSANTGNLFQRMFTDSRIAQNFSCGKTKCFYLINFGLASYFHDIWMSKLRQSSVKYVISFDESFNIGLQSEQMDVTIWFWDNQENKVADTLIPST